MRKYPVTFSTSIFIVVGSLSLSSFTATGQTNTSTPSSPLIAQTAPESPLGQPPPAAQTDQQMQQAATDTRRGFNWGWLGLLGLIGLAGLTRTRDEAVRYRETETSNRMR